MLKCEGMNTVSRTSKTLKDEASLSAPSSDPRWNGFLVLPENRFAVRAVRTVCRAVEANKRPSANPLVLHGPPGTGKTFLLTAVTTRLALDSNGITARTVSVGDLTRSPDEGLTDRDLFDCDVLALEDVQHLTDRTADAACDLIDHRIARRRVTIVTASHGPAALAHLPRRLTSRLAAGLVIQLEPLTASSRRAILADATVTKNVRLTDDALDLLAEQATTGVRAALGWLQNLAQIARAYPGPLGRTEVEQALTDSGQPTSAALDVSVIVKRVAVAFSVDEAELLGASRLRGIRRARQVAMYLARELTKLSLPRIGTAFGGRDHTTVLHACRKVESELTNDAALAKLLDELRTVLGK